MKTLNEYQTQKLIELKNKLSEESEKAQAFASIQTDEIKEVSYREESNIKLDVSKKINEIIYNL